MNARNDPRLAVLVRPELKPPPEPKPYIELYRCPREYDKDGRSYRPWQKGDLWHLSIEDARRIHADLTAALRELDERP